jgi:alpha-ketoglutarate-dependent taurine dioxygenase
VTGLAPSPADVGVSAVARLQGVERQRQAVLHRRRWYPPPPGTRPLAVRAADVMAARRDVQAEVDASGLAVVDLERPLNTFELRRVAGAFGEPIPERDETVQPFVTDGVVLRLEAGVRAPSTSLRPFSSSWISLHSEGSRWPAAHRPRLLLFQCLTPPRPDRGGQTVLRDVRDAIAALSASCRATLERTILEPERCDTPVLCPGVHGQTLTFRDPAPESVRWQSPARPDDVDAALLELLLVLYQRRRTHGVHWRRNRLVVLSNRRFLHGRSSMENDGRVLERVRIR